MGAAVTVNKSGDWALAARILRTAPLKIRRAMDRAVMQEAQFFRRKVVEGFRTQAPGGKRFAPLSEFTLAARRLKGFSGTKALIVRGDLRNSVTVVKRPKPLGAEAFVGVLKSAKGRDGKSLVNIAEVHEFGAGPIVIAITPAMRKYMGAVFGEMGKSGSGGGGGGTSRGILIIRIPARPFMKPVADAFFSGPEAAARFQARVAAQMHGAFGAFGPGGTSTAGARRRAQADANARRGPAGRMPDTGRFVARPPARLGFRFFR